MAKPSLQQVFGPNAVETAEYIQISKADLSRFGLIPAATNTAESLKVAIDLQEMDFLTPANQTANPDQRITMEYGFNSLVSRNSNTYYQRQLTNSYQEIFATSVLNPAHY